jgi:hypothetical protein
MSPRRPDTSPQLSKDTPGPGAYDQSKFYMTLKQSATARIGNSRREGFLTSDKSIPGPCQYEVKDVNVVLKRDPRPVFGSAERSTLYTNKA